MLTEESPYDPIHAENAADENKRPLLDVQQIVAYCLANIGYGMFFAFNNGALTLWLHQFTKDARLIGMLGGSHSFEGVVLQPLAGSISDRLRSPLGRRRPLLLLFVPISCLFLCLTPLAAHIPQGRLIWIVAGIVLFTCTFNLAFDPYQALLADVTSPVQRSRVAAFWYLASAVGQVGILFLHLPLTIKFYVVAALMLLTTLVTIAGTPERSTVNVAKSSHRKRAEMTRAFGGLKTLAQARLYLIMFLLYGAGTDAITPNLTLFVKTITHCSDDAAQKCLMIVLLTMGIAMLPCGWLADRVGTKNVLSAGFLLVGLASLLGLWVKTLPQIWCVMALAGVATAAQNAGAFPLLTRLVPAKEIGFYTGLQSAVISITGPLSIWLTGTLINHGGYRMMFAVCTVFTILASIFLVPINLKVARQEIVDREAAEAV